jgi:hypothetical protein
MNQFVGGRFNILNRTAMVDQDFQHLARVQPLDLIDSFKGGYRTEIAHAIQFFHDKLLRNHEIGFFRTVQRYTHPNGFFAAKRFFPAIIDHSAPRPSF